MDVSRASDIAYGASAARASVAVKGTDSLASKDIVGWGCSSETESGDEDGEGERNCRPYSLRARTDSSLIATSNFYTEPSTHMMSL